MKCMGIKPQDGQMQKRMQELNATTNAKLLAVIIYRAGGHFEENVLKVAMLKVDNTLLDIQNSHFKPITTN